MKFLAGNEERFFNFINNLNDKDKIAIIGHTDGDGICSTILATKVIKPDLVSFYGFDPRDFPKLIKLMKKKGINKIIFLDLNLVEKEIKEVEKFAEILLIDHHHPFENDLNSKKTVFLKVDCGANCYVCYYLFSKLKKIPEWIAALGTLSDMSYKYSKENIHNFFRDFGFSEIENLKEKTFNLSLAIIYFRNNLNKIYQILIKSEDYNNLGIEKYANIVKKEYENIRSKFEKNKEIYGDLMFYYFKTKYEIKTLVINKISMKYPDKTLVFVQSINGEPILEISSRRQDGKINCPNLLKMAVSGIKNSNAGGHLKAAGGTIMKKDFPRFKKNLILTYKKIIGKF